MGGTGGMGGMTASSSTGVGGDTGGTGGGGGGGGVAAPDGKVYWVQEQTGVHRSDLDGADPETIVDGTDAPNPFGVDVDPDGLKLYWTEEAQGIWKADLDGTNRENIISGLVGFPYAVAVDSTGGKVYYSVIDERGGDPKSSIWRANLDGSGPQQIVTGLYFTVGLAIDAAGGKLYVAEDADGGDVVFRVNLDGSGTKDTIVTSLDTVGGVTLDLPAQKAYWSAEGVGIQRRNMDGTGAIETPILAMEQPKGLDLGGGKAYWGEGNTGNTSAAVERANLDGTSIETVASGGTEDIFDVALHIVSPGQ
jgi:sugar lactone lactonase YvrE